MTICLEMISIVSWSLIVSLRASVREESRKSVFVDEFWSGIGILLLSRALELLVNITI